MAEYSLEFVFDSIFGCEDVSFSVKDFLYSGVVGFLAGETFEFSNIINLPNELRSYFNGKGQAESAEEIKTYFNSVNPKILKSIATGNLELVGKVMKDIPAESFNNASKLLDSTAKKPDDYLGKNSKIDDVLYGKYQKNNSKYKQLQNANGDYIIEVRKSELSNEPNSITQVVNNKGGINRNYYGDDGRQIKQISNNGHGHPIEEAMGKHGEHAHDYYLNEKGELERQPARELTDLERKENEDFL